MASVPALALPTMRTHEPRGFSLPTMRTHEPRSLSLPTRRTHEPMGLSKTQMMMVRAGATSPPPPPEKINFSNFPTNPTKKAFIWVIDNRDVIVIAKRLVELGYEIFSCKNTIYLLHEHDIPVTLFEKERPEEPGFFDILIINLFEKHLLSPLGTAMPAFSPFATTTPLIVCQRNIYNINPVIVVDPLDYTELPILLRWLEAYGEDSYATASLLKLKMKQENHFNSCFHSY